jgi:hypothetical protein
LALSTAIQSTTDLSKTLDERMAAAAPAIEVLRSRWQAGDDRLAAIELALTEAAAAGAGADVVESSDAAAAAIEGALAAVAEASRLEVEALAAEAGLAAVAAADAVELSAAAAVAELEAELSGAAVAVAEVAAADAVVIDDEEEVVVVEEEEEVVEEVAAVAAAAEPEAETEVEEPTPAAEAALDTDTTRPPSTTTPPIVLRVRCRTSPGETVAIVGSSPLLGGWDAGLAIPLEWTDGHVWSGELPPLPLSYEEEDEAAPIEFKAVLLTGQAAVWEAGSNRALPVAASPAPEDQEKEAAVVVEFEFAR